jgi:hypothetical protein
MKNTILNMGQWETRVSDVFHMVKLCKMTQEDAIEYYKKNIYSELYRKVGKTKPKHVYSVYMHGFVYGLMRAEQKRIERENLEFCYLVDGILFSTHRDTDKRKTEEFFQAGKGSYLVDKPSGFIWKGSDKVYFGFEPKSK